MKQINIYYNCCKYDKFSIADGITSISFFWKSLLYI